MNTALGFRTLATALLAFSFTTAQAQIVAGQVDDFQASLGNWVSGAAPNPVPPTLVLNVGPTGAGDHSMQLTGTGGFGPGRSPVALNFDQWTGNYLAAGATAIRLDMNNVGPSDLSMRFAFQSADLTTWWVSTEAYFIPSGSGWLSAELSLVEPDLTRVDGELSYAATFTDIGSARIFHSDQLLDYRGVPIEGALLVDNISAVPEPGLAALAALALGFAIHRRRLRARGA